MTKPDNTDRMTVSAYAEYRGISRRAVQFALADGRISKGADGKIDRAAADLAWSRNTDTSKPAATLPPGAKSSSQPSQSSPIEAVEGASYADNRAVREYHLARIAKTEADEAEGAVVDVEDVKAVWSKVANEVKTRVLAIGSKAKGRIPHLSAEEVLIIDDLVRDALQGVAECPLPSKR